MAFDEMVDGNRGVRPGWRGLLGVLAGLGREVLTERSQRLDRLAAEEGPPSLLPGVFDDYQQVPLGELAEGVRPDILGELYVLDRLAAGDAEHHATTALLRLAWQASPRAYQAFVHRTAADHREHPHLVSLLDAGD